MKPITDRYDLDRGGSPHPYPCDTCTHRNEPSQQEEAECDDCIHFSACMSRAYALPRGGDPPGLPFGAKWVWMRVGMSIFPSRASTCEEANSIGSLFLDNQPTAFTLVAPDLEAIKSALCEHVDRLFKGGMPDDVEGSQVAGENKDG